jgi:hypothetical protein
MYSAIWAYPWDFLDEGVDTVLDRVAEAGLNGVSVAAAYHNVRALCPHNPRRAVYHGEGGVLYFRPPDDIFAETRIRPVISDLVGQEELLPELCQAAHKRGLKVHAWTVLHHNSRLGAAYPDCSLQNAFGDRYPFGLCPSNPDVRAYTTGLVRALAAYETLDTIDLESLGYMGIDHSGHHAKQGVETDEMHRFLLSLCFCPHCASRMEANGVDADAARETVARELRDFFNGRFRMTREETLGALEDVLGEETCEGILAARDEAVLTLLEDLYWLVKKPQCLSVMVSGSPLATGAHAGVTLSQAREWTDRLLVQAFSRDVGAIRDTVADVAVRRGSTPVYAGLQAVAPFVRTSDELTMRVMAAAEAGAEGLQFYHYGLMPLENLGWIREALAEV